MADTSSSSSSSSRRETLPAPSSSSTSSPRRAAARRSLNAHATAPPAADLIKSRPSLLGKRKEVPESNLITEPSVTSRSGRKSVATNDAPSSSDPVMPADEAETSTSASRRQSRSSISAPRLSGGRKSRGSNESSNVAATNKGSEGVKHNERVIALNTAVDKFLELIDEAAASENFSTTLPQLDPSLLNPLRETFISSLKSGIKQQHVEIVEDFNLDEKLRELQRLSQEADQRASRQPEDEEIKDVWKDELDIDNSIDAKCLSVRRELVEKLERECVDTQAANVTLFKELQTNVQEAESQQKESTKFLDTLEEAVQLLQGSEEVDEQFRSQLIELSKELGPRAV